MAAYIAKRLLGLLPTLLLVGFLVFLLVHLLPGDPARLAAGQDATPETVELVRKDLGLDKSLPPHFVPFVGGVLHVAAAAIRALRRRRVALGLRTVAAHEASGRHRDPRSLHADVLAHRM